MMRESEGEAAVWESFVFCATAGGGVVVGAGSVTGPCTVSGCTASVEFSGGAGCGGGARSCVVIAEPSDWGAFDVAPVSAVGDSCAALGSGGLG